MTIEEQKAVLTKGYTEANRYMDNANDVLAKSKKDGSYYAAPKYVRMACGTAYNGVLIALDAWLAQKGVPVPKKKRKSIEYYESNLAVLDKKMLTYLNTAYRALHLDGYYDGETNVKLISSGFDAAYYIIERIKPFSHEPA